MTDTDGASRAGEPVHEDAPALADAAARLLDRLRNEPLPAGRRTATALRQATRHAFILVEETRKLIGANAPSRVVPPPYVQKNTVDRQVFFDSVLSEADRKDRWESWADLDLETYRQRVGRIAARARKRT